MTSHFFLLSGKLSIERLTWIEECIKFFFINLYPESLVQRTPTGSPAITFLLTGDALYSLEESDSQEIWSVILSLSGVSIICDRQELDLRGVSIDRLKMKYPDQIINTNSLAADSHPSFWNDVVGLARRNRHPLPDAIGWLQNESPYMHLSAGYGTRCLSAGLEARLSVELYAHLDGIHMGHTGQNPTGSESISKNLDDLHDRAAKQGLTSLFIACSHSATTRGYSTWDDGQGLVISACTTKPFRIRDMNAMIDRFRYPHIILSENAGSIQFRQKGPAVSFDRAEKTSTAPPVTILVTRNPYSTEHAMGAISLAAACAHQGILTRVIFMEDGIYALTSSHRAPATGPFTNIQDVINAVAGSENLHFFALTPSFQKRGVAKEKDKERNLNAVLDIGYPGLAKILFYPPANVQAEHQRVLIF